MSTFGDSYNLTDFLFLLVDKLHNTYITNIFMHFQRLIQTEADLMRLEEVHSSLFNEHKNLQEDYERIHIYVEVSFS